MYRLFIFCVLVNSFSCLAQNTPIYKTPSGRWIDLAKPPSELPPPPNTTGLAAEGVRLDNKFSFLQNEKNRLDRFLAKNREIGSKLNEDQEEANNSRDELSDRYESLSNRKFNWTCPNGLSWNECSEQIHKDAANYSFSVQKNQLNNENDTLNSEQRLLNQRRNRLNEYKNSYNSQLNDYVSDLNGFNQDRKIVSAP